MCNAYEIGGQSGSFSGQERARRVSELTDAEGYLLIRRTDMAPVVLSEGEMAFMSWGFRREAFGVINNSRADKLGGTMWRAAFAERRCLIPMAGYFEWTGPKGRKQTHRFESPSGDLLWAAGIWEESQDHGCCFSMITTEANRMILPIHHRMPALLNDEEQKSFLKGETIPFDPPPAALVVRECENPLRGKKEPPAQGELF